MPPHPQSNSESHHEIRHEPAAVDRRAERRHAAGARDAQEASATTASSCRSSTRTLELRRVGQAARRPRPGAHRRHRSAAPTTTRSAPTPTSRRKGIDGTKRTLDCCAAAGVHARSSGPYHSALGLFSGAGPTDDEWKWGVESMRQVAEHAGKVGVTLGVECLNRFETYLLNCARRLGPLLPRGRIIRTAG